MSSIVFNFPDELTWYLIIDGVYHPISFTNKGSAESFKAWIDKQDFSKWLNKQENNFLELLKKLDKQDFEQWQINHHSQLTELLPKKRPAP